MRKLFHLVLAIKFGGSVRVEISEVWKTILVI